MDPRSTRENRVGSDRGGVNREERGSFLLVQNSPIYPMNPLMSRVDWKLGVEPFVNPLFGMNKQASAF